MAGLRIRSESGASRIGLDKACEEREELIYGGESKRSVSRGLGPLERDS